MGFTNEGKILALDLEIYNNGGHSLDLSLAVLERAILQSENVYDISNIRVSGQVCFTNLPSNTAFRGFGGPQGLLIAENWIHHIATELQRSPEEIKVSIHMCCEWYWPCHTIVGLTYLSIDRNLIFTMMELCCIMASCSRIVQ